MPEIIPAIIAKSFEELQEKVKLVEPHVKTVQLDIMDGVFVPERSWSNPEELKDLKTNLNLEAHLMVSEPEKQIDSWIISGVKRILVHFEATQQLAEIIKKVKNAGLEVGVVLNLETPETAADEYAGEINLVQLMGIAQIGYHGHPFEERVIPKISALRQKYPDVKIGVDGGINLQNAKKLVQAGADFLAVGSTIFESEDPEKIINLLNEAVK